MSNNTVRLFKALGNKIRVEIVRDLMNGHDTVCPEVRRKLSKSQPTLSHHINKLLNADVLIETKKGVNCYYKVNVTYLKSLGIDIKKAVNLGSRPSQQER